MQSRILCDGIDVVFKPSSENLGPIDGRANTDSSGQSWSETPTHEDIVTARQALALSPHVQPGDFQRYEDLFEILAQRYAQSKDRAVLEELLPLLTDILDNLPASHPMRFTSYERLQLYLHLQYTHTKDISLLGEAIDIGRQNLQWMVEKCANPVPLMLDFVKMHEEYARAAWDLSLVTKDLDFFFLVNANIPPDSHSESQVMVTLAELWLTCANCAKDMGLWLLLAFLSLYQALDLFTFKDEDWLKQFRNFLLRISKIEIPDGAGLREVLLAVYIKFIEAVLIHCFLMRGDEGRLALISAAGILWQNAYAHAHAVGDLNRGITILERARGVVWSHILQSRKLLSIIEQQGASAGTELEQNKSSGEDESNQGRNDEHDITDTEKPSILDSWSPSFAQVYRVFRSSPILTNAIYTPEPKALLATSAMHPVVILIAEENRSYALVIQSPHVPLVSLPLDIPLSSLLLMTARSFSFQAQRGSTPLEDESIDCTRLAMKIAERSSTSHRILAELWLHVVKPVITHLGLSRVGSEFLTRPRIHWCPTGPFAFVPVHAAGIYEGGDPESCFDYVVSSYTPTLAALMHAQKDIPNLSRRNLKLALIAADEAQDSTLPVLPNVNEEIRATINLAERCEITVLSDTKGSRLSTQDAANLFESAHFVHVSCHGLQHPTEPLQSAFCLSDGHLTVEKLMHNELKDAFFAFLSACETAKGDWEQPDQAIHLAATMLCVGFKSIVATMWAMDDIDGPFIAKHFYEKLFEKEAIDADSIPYALDYAVNELRKSAVPPERWATFIHMGV